MPPPTGPLPAADLGPMDCRRVPAASTGGARTAGAGEGAGVGDRHGHRATERAAARAQGSDGGGAGRCLRCGPRAADPPRREPQRCGQSRAGQRPSPLTGSRSAATSLNLRPRPPERAGASGRPCARWPPRPSHPPPPRGPDATLRCGATAVAVHGWPATSTATPSATSRAIRETTANPGNPFPAATEREAISAR